MCSPEGMVADPFLMTADLAELRALERYRMSRAAKWTKEPGAVISERKSCAAVSNHPQAKLPSVTAPLGNTQHRSSPSQTAGPPRPSRTRALSPFPSNSLGVVRGAGCCACSTRTGGRGKAGRHSSGWAGPCHAAVWSHAPGPGRQCAFRSGARPTPSLPRPRARTVAHPEAAIAPSENQQRHVFASRRKAGDQSWTPARRY